MPTNQIQLICDCIRNVPDFPKPGIQFKDITPVLSNPAAFDAAIEALAAPYKNSDIDLVVGIEARGFIFGTPVARLLDVGFVPIRKPGKLPWKTHSTSYELEYGSDALEIHADAVAKGQRVLVVDDLLATGGTARAACDLLEEMGADVVEITVLIELESLEGRDKLAPFNARSVLTF
ncbi:uncharacterized protein METZ01_LOCUS8753 [marine metagenome]|jgi:adenine phosphoribosyltransferase|uniref:adenine phosphoribosyltransferase n=1 Tax=marine metagenome TaxID=408172 RepID=A0A381NNG7_9ZZZZ|tara:strand:+ start:662 stop:1192 length:531 start_codon:yes stop_codon:yes gene_type:complete